MAVMFKEKIKQIINLANNLGLSLVAGAEDSSGKLESFCSREYSASNSEEMINIYLMIKNKGDLNRFLLEKSKVERFNNTEHSMTTMNPQVLKTKH